MRLTVFGTGYVGLVTGLCFAEMGNQVCCVDIDLKKVEQLKKGLSPIYEPGIEKLLTRAIQNKTVIFTDSIQEGVAFSEVYILAVGTPARKDGTPNLDYLSGLAKAIANYLEKPNAIVINKSTVPVGTADKVTKIIQERLDEQQKPLAFHVASNPEFLKEGAAINDFMKPDRIIVGTENDYVKKTMQKLYSPFNRNHDKLMFMDVRSAELTKYAANAMLATKISFMNEMANIAERVGADIESVRKGIGSDPRIGYHFIYPGCGYGGSCFPKDVAAIEYTASQVDYEAKIVQSVQQVNEKQKSILFEKIMDYFKGELKNKTIALWGLAFKPNTDDIREAPSLVLIKALIEQGAKIQAFDPVASTNVKKYFGENPYIVYSETKEDCLKQADCLVLCTEWQEFRSPDFNKIKESLIAPVIFDGRNIFEPVNMREQGFTYLSIGRK